MPLSKRQHSPVFKARVALELLRADEAVSQICSRYALHPTQARRWKQAAIAGLPQLFSDQAVKQLKRKDEFIEELYKQIGQLKVELEWLKKRWALTLPTSKKLELIDPEHQFLSVRRQCALLQLNRSTWYHQADKRPALAQADIELMHQIDEIWTEAPFYGSRKTAKELSRRNGQLVNRKRAQRLMRIMGIEAIYPKPKTSYPNLQHQIYPYLLKGLAVTRPNQVWGTDITYIRMHQNWLYLVAIMDWFSRRVLARELSDRLEAEFCIRTLKTALEQALPDIHNSDQGSQFTADEYLVVLRAYPDIKISMDGRGRAFDNIFNERLWRTVKQEEVYLKDYASFREAKESLTEYLNFYNQKRIHQSLNYQTPTEVYFGKTD